MCLGRQTCLWTMNDIYNKIQRERQKEKMGEHKKAAGEGKMLMGGSSRISFVN